MTPEASYWLTQAPAATPQGWVNHFKDGKRLFVVPLLHIPTHGLGTSAQGAGML